ncbi:kelch domain-containing protein 1-like [Takifugu rubripes]|uniref:Kelch domain-containing protein 1-like n=1 Tax=Takifugu rubripes TaxID=31033 RepID=A0A674MYJ0_TAKRU|nr:kelch domain-containing protein 1-like [Takifugu rubripes]|eukprot:XP_003977277.1 PREDICTED: kelch domain-containing protein 1-like [Takifugu rubripes]
MDCVERPGRLERSGHAAFIDNNTLFVWGGYQVVAGDDVTLPSDEIWLCDLDSGTWERRDMAGDKPPDLSGFCGANVDGTLYVFAGCHNNQYTNEMYSVDLTKQPFSWRRVTDTKGTTPSPRNSHSCWVHRDRLIYFGGYGCKTMGEMQNTPATNFILEDMSWAVIGNTLFRCWGWNNEVNVFDTHAATWSAPEIRGPLPTPRGCHASAVLGNKGYIAGGVEAKELDMFCLDLDTWTWTQIDVSRSRSPPGRSMLTMTCVSDEALFIYGGLGMDGNTLGDAWRFDTRERSWSPVRHPHKDKPRVCHTACLGSDGDVVVFGGSGDMRILQDTVVFMRAPSPHHCRDVLVFQTQPYSLCRLCEDFIGKHATLFDEQLDWLPARMRGKIDKRAAALSAAAPGLIA